MTLRSELKTLEAGLSISSPVTIASAEAFESTPDRNLALAKRKAVFENIPHAPREVGQMGASREILQTVTVRFSAYDADFDRAIEIADSFKSAFTSAIAAQRRAGERLNGTFEMVTFGDSETPFEAFDGRPGWQVTLDFTIFETVVFA